jgi:hypothetical protein
VPQCPRPIEEGFLQSALRAIEPFRHPLELEERMRLVPFGPPSRRPFQHGPSHFQRSFRFVRLSRQRVQVHARVLHGRAT